jgi:two-component system cell cycle response regulator
MGTRLPFGLDALLAEARRNEITLRKFQSLELDLLGCRSLADLIRMLLYDRRESFDWDVVTLALIDPEYEIRRLLSETDLSAAAHCELIFVTEPDLDLEPYRVEPLPRLGAYKESLHALLFPEPIEPPASVAVLPLARNEQVIGILTIGSLDSQRFGPDAATDFLQHLAAVIAMCLESMVNHERLKHAGLTDPLTGINNRRFFDQRLNEEVARSRRTGRPLSALFVDVDHFKAINDEYGHPVGDKALQTVAALIREQLRSHDVVARYGGEEFAALLADADAVIAAEIAERLRRKLAERVFHIAEDTRLTLSISIGVATLQCTENLRQIDSVRLGAELTEAADRALYQAKRAGRNRVVSAAPDT